jgi:catechol 2,3-dioxygenase-like lactoylglutathione lyase family enzyme
MVSLAGLDHLVLTVRDIGKTVRFYNEILGMKSEVFQASDSTERTALNFGSQKINLHQAGAEFEPKASAATPGSADLCFLTELTLDVWQWHLENSGTEILVGPVARTGARGNITSIYKRDPDGNLIEIATYD